MLDRLRYGSRKPSQLSPTDELRQGILSHSSMYVLLVRKVLNKGRGRGSALSDHSIVLPPHRMLVITVGVETGYEHSISTRAKLTW